MANGIVIIDKPAGWTSMDVCGKLRSVLKTRKVGHAGTLDPMATGVLPVFVGQATRAVSFAETGDKEYVAGLRLGCVTNTQDTSGDVLELCDEKAKIVDHVHTGAILVDGLGVGDVGNIVLRDRQHLAEDGIMIVVMTLEKYSNVVLAGPDIVSRGFVYVRESEDLMDHAREVVEQALDGCLDKGITDWSKIKAAVKDALSEYVWKRTKRSPMILPIIMEA